jgi:hypothetical protein
MNNISVQTGGSGTTGTPGGVKHATRSSVTANKKKLAVSKQKVVKSVAHCESNMSI